MGYCYILLMVMMWAGLRLTLTTPLLLYVGESMKSMCLLSGVIKTLVSILIVIDW